MFTVSNMTCSKECSKYPWNVDSLYRTPEEVEKQGYLNADKAYLELKTAQICMKIELHILIGMYI